MNRYGRNELMLAMRVARAFGMPLVAFRRRPLWDGTVLAIGGLDAGDVLHELSHWLVASEDRRAQPNYGLGIDFAGGWSERSMSCDLTEREEERASLLGIGFEAALGLDWEATLIDHSWLDLDVEERPAEFWGTVHWLNQKGLLNGSRPAFPNERRRP